MVLGSQPWGENEEPPADHRFREPPGTGRNHLSFEPLAQFIARAEREPERTWLLPALVPDRGRLFVVAPPSAGKTWLALAAAKAACGADREVWFIEEEGSARGFGERLKALRFPDGARVQVAHLRSVKVDDGAHRRQLAALLRASLAPVLVLDPMTSLWSGDENDTRSANALRAQLDDLANANPAALLVVLHHTSKSATNGEGHELNAGRGSSVFAGWADVQLNLKHMSCSGGRIDLDVLVAKDREGERGKRVNVRLDLATGEVTIDDAPAPTAALEARILTALRAAPAGLTKNGLAASVTGKRQAILEAVDRLVGRGHVTWNDKVCRVAPNSEVGP